MPLGTVTLRADAIPASLRTRVYTAALVLGLLAGAATTFAEILAPAIAADVAGIAGAVAALAAAVAGALGVCYRPDRLTVDVDVDVHTAIEERP